MNKLIRPKNALKITSVFLCDKPQNNGGVVLEAKKKCFYVVVGKEGATYIKICGKEEKLHKNQIAITAANAKFIIKENDSEIYNVIGFEGSFNSKKITNKIINLSALTGSVYKELISKITAKEVFKEREIALIISLLEYLLNSLIDGESISNFKSNDYAVFTEAVRHIKDNVDKDVSIKNMASYLCVSPTKLKRVFAKYSALSVHKFVLAVKLEKAKGYLNKGLSSKEISRRLGFDNPNYFSAVFKREIGKNPSEYRKSIIENIK